MKNESMKHVSQHMKARAVLEETIAQKVFINIKANQMLVGTIDKATMYLYLGNKEEVVAQNDIEKASTLREVPLIVWTNDVTSPFYSLTATNSGMLDRMGETKQVKQVFRTENTVNGVNSVYMDKEVYVNTWEYHLQLGGKPKRRAFLVTEEDVMALNDGDRFDNFGMLKPFIGSPSQTRKGDAPFINAELGRGKALKSIGFKFTSFYKQKELARQLIDVIKAGKRPKLGGSSSKSFPLFEGVTYKGKTAKPYKYHQGDNLDELEVTERQSQVFMFEKDNDEVVIEVAPDFEVLTQELLTLTCFDKPQVITLRAGDTHTQAGRLRIKRRQELMRRLATDGAAYVDAAYARKMGLTESGVQFRFTPVGKGLLVLVPGLKKATGSDMILFDGAVKGNIEQYFKEGMMEFAILNVVRRTEMENNYKLSRQMVTAINNKAMLNGLMKDTIQVLDDVYKLDPEKVKEFVGVHILSEQDAVDEQDEEQVLDIENLTADLFGTNDKTFIKSASFKNKLLNLIEATTKSLRNGGSLYVKETSMKHMIVDPFAIMSYLSDGWLSAVRNGDGERGIRRHHAIVSAMDEAGLFVEHKKAFLGRFPFLHKLEGQIVNADEKSWNTDAVSKQYYDMAISKGYFQGLLIYSLWDMKPEGQSGADFDGDTSIYSTNPILVDNFANDELYLDYSLVQNDDGEYDLVEGCPFPGEGQIALSNVLSKKQIAWLDEHDVHYDGGTFDFPEDIGEDEDFQDILADAMCELAMIGLVGNDIGKYTNINASVMSLIDVLKNNARKVRAAGMQAYEAGDMVAAQELKAVFNQLKDEIKGYENLSFYMAAAIRWEIDKAKHGGAYKDNMPFLKVIDERGADLEEVRQLEEECGVSLERLLFGSIK